MNPRSTLILMATILAVPVLVQAEDKVEIKPDENGLFVMSFNDSSVQTTNFKTPVPNIVNLEFERHPGQDERAEKPTLIYNPTAETVFVLPDPRLDVASEIPGIVIESADKSGQQSDGRILFTAADARVVGDKAKLESHPGNSRIGFWTSLEDSVEWDYEATRPGSYRVTLCCSRAAEKPAKVQLIVGEETLTSEIAGTGSWYVYQPHSFGKIKIPGPGKLTVSVKGLESDGALMNLKGVVLTPVSEGKAVQTAGEDGAILCHSRDATIRGVKAQYEPKPEKNTVGYWTNVKDRVSWDVKFDQPGVYDLEIWQGCGRGHGGSEVKVVMDDQALSMAVEDTGHFQNFKPRVIGQFNIEQPGIRRFTIVPVTKASAAVMDVRQVRLIPAAKK